MFCDFDNATRTCPKCGYYAKRLPTFRECRPVPEKVWRPIAVGDAVERFLTSVGITKDRVERLTRTAGTPGGCGCEGRKKWLNEVGFKAQRAASEMGGMMRKFYFGDGPVDMDNQ